MLKLAFVRLNNVTNVYSLTLNEKEKKADSVIKDDCEIEKIFSVPLFVFSGKLRERMMFHDLLSL